MNTGAKKKRRQQASAWVKEYSGNRIIHAYMRKFKVPIAAAVNDLVAVGVRLDPEEVARIRINLHHTHVQHLPRKRYREMLDFVKGGEDHQECF